VHQQNGTPGAPPLRQDTSNISISHALSLYPASHHMFLDGRIRKMVHQAHHLHHDTSNISSHALTSSCVPCNILSHALTHPASHALSQAMHSLHPASHRVSGRVALRLGHVSCRAAPQERGAVPTAKDKGVCRERKAGRQAGRKQVKEEGGCTAGSSESRSKRRVAVLPAHQKAGQRGGWLYCRLISLGFRLRRSKRRVAVLPAHQLGVQVVPVLQGQQVLCLHVTRVPSI